MHSRAQLAFLLGIFLWSVSLGFCAWTASSIRPTITRFDRLPANVTVSSVLVSSFRSELSASRASYSSRYYATRLTTSSSLLPVAQSAVLAPALVTSAPLPTAAAIRRRQVDDGDLYTGQFEKVVTVGRFERVARSIFGLLIVMAICDGLFILLGVFFCFRHRNTPSDNESGRTTSHSSAANKETPEQQHALMTNTDEVKTFITLLTLLFWSSFVLLVVLFVTGLAAFILLGYWFGIANDQQRTTIAFWVLGVLAAGTGCCLLRHDTMKAKQLL